jgi:hypothetical protein
VTGDFVIGTSYDCPPYLSDYSDKIVLEVVMWSPITSSSLDYALPLEVESGWDYHEWHIHPE